MRWPVHLQSNLSQALPIVFMDELVNLAVAMADHPLQDRHLHFRARMNLDCQPVDNYFLNSPWGGRIPSIRTRNDPKHRPSLATLILHLQHANLEIVYGLLCAPGGCPVATAPSVRR